jgi:hypothetical protein
MLEEAGVDGVGERTRCWCRLLIVQPIRSAFLQDAGVPVVASRDDTHEVDVGRRHNTSYVAKKLGSKHVHGAGAGFDVRVGRQPSSDYRRDRRFKVQGLSMTPHKPRGARGDSEPSYTVT